MSNLYDDREQSLAKHEILRRYLVPFANKILSTWESIDYIDCFSGPWKNVDSENLTDTSIGISLRTLSDVARARGHTREDRRIRCIFNEANHSSFLRLKDFLARCSTDFPLLKISAFEGRFEDNAQEIKAKADHKFQLVFVDPTGYKGFSPIALSVFRGRSSEIIVNFMRSFIERFVSGNHRDKEEALIGLIGKERAIQYLSGASSIERLEVFYLDMLKRDLGYKFAGFSPIHNPDRNEIHFNLAYGTNHFAGMEVMRSAEYKALSAHDVARLKKELERQGGDLFSGMLGEMEILGPYLRARKEHRQNACRILLDILSGYPSGIEFCKLAATAQQELYLKRSELGDVVVELAGKGSVRDSWQERNARKPAEKDIISRT